MKRKDLRNNIIPTTIKNTDDSLNTDNPRFYTTDLIYLSSYESLSATKKNNYEKRISATDFAIMNNAPISFDYETLTGKPSTVVYLRTAFDRQNIRVINDNGDTNFYCTSNVSRNVGICPTLRYSLPHNDSLFSKLFSFKKQKINEEKEQFCIKDVKSLDGKIICHTLQIGEYPKTKVNNDLSKTLESLYNNGNLQEGISCTGRWYSSNGQIINAKDYAGKHNPEFEYQGERYVRVVSYPYTRSDRYSDGTSTGNSGIIRWAKVEPISFIINNWEQMPKNINPKGNGTAKYFDLKAEEAIIANIPFYPEKEGKNISMWQNSSIRGFLNGIDVRDIQSNGNIHHGASHGGNFTGECNFLNEAFNLSREPIIEYTIPDSETEIPNDAFNGCVSLKKLIIHSGIKSIGENAFDGLNFKYAYKLKSGELIFSQELPTKDDYTQLVDLDKLTKSFEGFDYNILLEQDELDQLIKLFDVLNKNKFSIPYKYGLELIKSKKIQLLCENTDFRFFKNEIPEINNMLSNFSEYEKINFYKFANSLGCFSTEKIKDKKGKETDVLLAQKASSFLAIILKTNVISLR